MSCTIWADSIWSPNPNPFNLFQEFYNLLFTWNSDLLGELDFAIALHIEVLLPLDYCFPYLDKQLYTGNISWQLSALAACRLETRMKISNCSIFDTFQVISLGFSMKNMLPPFISSELVQCIQAMVHLLKLLLKQMLSVDDKFVFYL